MWTRRKEGAECAGEEQQGTEQSGQEPGAVAKSSLRPEQGQRQEEQNGERNGFDSQGQACNQSACKGLLPPGEGNARGCKGDGWGVPSSHRSRQHQKRCTGAHEAAGPGVAPESLAELGTGHRSDRTAEHAQSSSSPEETDEHGENGIGVAAELDSCFCTGAVGSKSPSSNKKRAHHTDDHGKQHQATEDGDATLSERESRAHCSTS